jgi:hypothetical protein
VIAGLLNLKGDDMADAGAQKSKTGDVDAKDKKQDETLEAVENQAADSLEADASARDEDRSEADRDQQQDLDQGMDTGTHDSERTGINWGDDYKVRPGDHKILRGNTPDEPPKK